MAILKSSSRSAEETGVKAHTYGSGLGQRAVHAKGLMLYIAYAAALAVMGLIAGVGYYWKKQQSVEISDSYGPALG